MAEWVECGYIRVVVGRLFRSGARGRVGLAALGALALVSLALTAAPFLWLFGALRGVEWDGDFVTAVAITLLIYVSLSAGFVLADWRTPLYLWAGSAVWVLVRQAMWIDAPGRSGIDDLQPAFLLPFTPFVALLPLAGLGVQRVAARATR